MPKHIVVCCDGTWNTYHQPNRTNVRKLYDAVAGSAGDVAQEKLYVEGVGNTPWKRLTGGAFGVGLSDNVLKAYRFVVENYEPGDELFFFGFSRGAYTARSTAGLIRNCGILLRQNEDRVDEAYRLYRGRDKTTTGPESPVARRFRTDLSHHGPDRTPIRFIGVWDTVGALGIPLSGGRLLNVFNRRWQFHDTQLSSTVRSAFHALAVDEKRRSFVPTAWRTSPAAAGLEREQVWFAGDHSDIGGGHGDNGLSDVTLEWMATGARSCGLAFTPSALADMTPNPLGTLHTMHPLFRLLGTLDRPIGTSDPDGESAASTAEHRITAPLTPPYDPPNLRTYLGHRQRKITPV